MFYIHFEHARGEKCTKPDNRLFLSYFDPLIQCPAPTALFFVNGKGQLTPLAIQLHQQIELDNPVSLISRL